jgi:hypothetical protein
VRRRFTRVLRLWFACLAVFAAAAAPVHAASAPERPAVVSMLRVERRTQAPTAAFVAPPVFPQQPPALALAPRAPRGKLYLHHCALLR